MELFQVLYQAHLTLRAFKNNVCNLAHPLLKRLFQEEIFAQAIAYPTVPKGKARIRVMISAVHTKEDLDFAIDKFAKVGRALGVI